jgi:hypothetical protein
MSDEPQQKGYRIPYAFRAPVSPPEGSMGRIGSVKEHISKPAPKSFSWDDARDIATFVRDGLLLIVKGIERKFDLGKKNG